MNAHPLANRRCIPCQEGSAPLQGDALRNLVRQLARGWEILETHHLRKEFKFKDFKQALAFTNQIGEIAEREQHHPDLHLAWGQVVVTIWTHKVDGLTENDFILAAKIDELSPS